MAVSRLSRYGMELITIDIDFAASSSENAIIDMSKPIHDVLRARLWIDVDPGAAFAEFLTLSMYNKAAKRGEDAFYRVEAKLVYDELSTATVIGSPNIIPNSHVEYSLHDLVTFLDDDELSRLSTIAATMVAEDNLLAVHPIGTGLSRVAEFNDLFLYNDEGGTDVYCTLEFDAVQTVSTKLELLVRL